MPKERDEVSRTSAHEISGGQGRWIRTTAVALVALLAMLPVATTAHADEVRVADPTGDTTARSDIKWVEVLHSRSEDLFKVRTRLSEVLIGVKLVMYVDRNRGNPGPELRMVAYADSEWQLYRVNRWDDRGQQIVTCGKVRYTVGSEKPIASWSATRSCLRLDRSVRVAVKVDDDGYGNDWAPARRDFTPWVNAAAPAVPTHERQFQRYG
jgi:hypothetical protein